MGFTVNLKFDSAEDMFALIERFAGMFPASGAATILARMQQMSTTMQSELEELTATVAEVASVNGGLKALIGGLPALIQRAVDDAVAKGATTDQVAALAGLNDSLRAQVNDMAAAVTQGTVAEGEDEGEDTMPGGDTPPEQMPVEDGTPPDGEPVDPAPVPADTVPGA